MLPKNDPTLTPPCDGSLAWLREKDMVDEGLGRAAGSTRRVALGREDPQGVKRGSLWSPSGLGP